MTCRARSALLWGGVLLTGIAAGLACSGQLGSAEGSANDESSAQDDSGDDVLPGQSGATTSERGPYSSEGAPNSPGASGAPASPGQGIPGASDDGSDPASPGSDPSNPSSPDAPDAQDSSATGVDEFTRLTREEYAATIEWAFGERANMALIPVDGRVEGYTSNVDVKPDPVHPYLLAAEDMSAALVPQRLQACDASDALSCLRSEYSDALERLFRRPLSDAELGTLAKMIDDLLLAGASDVEATRAMLSSTLVSPDFLYRATQGVASGADVERRLAERVSYVLWDGPADERLLEAVDGGALGVELPRVAADDRATRVLARFLGQWLGVDIDLRLESGDYADAHEYLELLSLVETAVAEQMPVTDFVGGRRGFVHEDNSDAYAMRGSDLPAAPDERDVVSVEWDEDSPRRGLLTQDMMVASTRHPDASRRPIFRGLLVRRSLLCDEIPAPSADLVELAGEVGDRTEDQRCAGCHMLIDPIGKAFAVLDDESEVVPAEIVGHTELEGSYAGLAQLLEAVSKSRAFAECFSRQWLSFFLERPMHELDANWVVQLSDSVQAGATLTDIIELTVSELDSRMRQQPLWCEGPSDE